MKSIFFFLILSILLAKNSLAQSGNDIESSKFGYGIKIGAIYGRTLMVSNNFTYDITPGLSYTGGAFCWMKINRFLSIQPELSFSQLAFKINNIYYTDANGSDLGMLTTKIKLNYIQVPVMLKVTLPKTGLSIMPGLQFGYLTSTNVKIGSYNDFKNSQAYKNFDLGLVFGLQYHFTSKIELSTRKSISILNVAKNSPGTIALPTATYLTIGYQF